MVAKNFWPYEMLLRFLIKSSSFQDVIMDRPIVVISSPMDKAGFKKLEASVDIRFADHKLVPEAEFVALMRDAEGVVVRSLPVTSALLAECPNLKIVAKHGAGVDNIDVDACTKLGIIVCNSGGANASGVAEGAMALLFAVLRRIPDMQRIVTGDSFASDRDKLRFADLTGKTVGLLGFGNIGRHFARMCAGGFQTRMLAYDPAVSAQDMKAAGVEKADTLAEMLSQIDVLSIHAPLVPSTKHIIGANELDLMKKSAILVNTSRGGLVDEQALADALENGVIAGAGIDVFEIEPPMPDNPMFTARNIVLTPHCAGGSASAYVNAATESAQGILDVFCGRKPRYIINSKVLGSTRITLPL